MVPSAIWMAFIALESTNLGSSENTSRLYPIFYFVFAMDSVRFTAWHHALRKAGHFVGYFTFSVLLFRSWRASFPRLSTRWCMQWATLAFFNTALVALLDEWHQTLLPSRAGLFGDVILDTAGLLPNLLFSSFWALNLRHTVVQFMSNFWLKQLERTAASRRWVMLPARLRFAIWPSRACLTSY